MDDQQSSGNLPEIIKSRQICAGQGLTVEYSLYRHRFLKRESFSVRAVLKNTGECAFVPDITSDPATAEHIFDLIVRGGVTPCCIFEVIEDIIESMPEEAPSPSVPCPV